MARGGFDVIGIDPKFNGEVPTEPWETMEPDVAWPEGIGSVRFSDEPQRADMSFIVVPTPSEDKRDHRGGFDSSMVEAALRHIRTANEKNHIAVIISTLSPGAVEEISTKPVIRDLRIVYNPTFIAIGSVVHDLIYPDLLLLGSPSTHRNSARDVQAVWEQVFSEHHWNGLPYVHNASYTEVELIKLSVNCFLGTKISLANSLGQLFAAYDIDPKAVTVVGRDHRIGTAYFTPGSPIAGPCLPRDNRALQYAATKKGINMPLSVATDRVNHELTDYYFGLCCGRDNDHVGHRPKSVGILGISYKYGTDITTGSAGEALAKRLEASGIEHVEYDDLLAKDTISDALKCEVVVVTQREYEPLVAKYNGTIVRVWS